MREAEEEAKRLLERWGNETPPVDVMEIALQEGIELRLAPAGMCTCCAVIDGKKIIWVNRRDPPTRKRFRIAHEIFEFLGFPERECDAGAASLLMPEDWVVSFTRREQGNLLSLARIFRVSNEAMAYRLASLFHLAVTIVDFHLLTVRLGAPFPLLPDEKRAIQEAYQKSTPIRICCEELSFQAFPIPPFPSSRVILLSGNSQWIP